MMQAVQTANQSMIKWDSKAFPPPLFVMFITIVVLVTHTHTYNGKKKICQISNNIHCIPVITHR